MACDKLVSVRHFLPPSNEETLDYHVAISHPTEVQALQVRREI